MNDFFPLLGIETSGELCSSAVMLDENKYSQFDIRMKHVHSEKLLSMIEETLKSVNLTVKDLKGIAVSEGPGSFTGLRIGMAAAKGLAMGAGLPIIPVPTFEAFAFKIIPYLKGNESFSIVNNVNIEELYYSKFRKNENSYTVEIPLKLMLKKEFVKDEDSVFGNYIKDSMRAEDSPSALDITRWAYKFGKSLVTYQYDFLEPKYLKNFVARMKK